MYAWLSRISQMRAVDACLLVTHEVYAAWQGKLQVRGALEGCQGIPVFWVRNANQLIAARRGL
jgi:hypothetical protein